MILLQVDYKDFKTSIVNVDFPTSHVTFLYLRTKLRRIRNFLLTSFQYLWLYWMCCPSYYINSFFRSFGPFTMKF
jgi:hypothetical protein